MSRRTSSRSPRSPRSAQARANKSYPAKVAGPFALAQAHGFTPGSWRKRADGVVELQVTNAWGTPLPAWYRDTPREELFVLEASKDTPPAWAERSGFRGSRQNPKVDPLAFIAADPEAAVMATLMPEQLWSQSSGAGNAWAMWELQRRGQMTPWVRTNPRTTFGAKRSHSDEDGYWYQGYVEIDGKRRNLGGYSSDKKGALDMARREAQRVDVAKGFATFKKGSVKSALRARSNPNQGMDVLMILGEDGPPMGGEWAQWAQSREGIMHRNPRGVSKELAARLLSSLSVGVYATLEGQVRAAPVGEATSQLLSEMNTLLRASGLQAGSWQFDGVNSFSVVSKQDRGKQNPRASRFSKETRVGDFTVESWWDGEARVITTYIKDANGNQVGDADFDAQPVSAEISHANKVRALQARGNPRAARNHHIPVGGYAKLPNNAYALITSPPRVASWTRQPRDIYSAIAAGRRSDGILYVHPFNVWDDINYAKPVARSEVPADILEALDARAAQSNPRQVTGPDACSRCEGTGYAGPHGDTCSRCEGSGVDALHSCEGGCGRSVRESQGMCRACAAAEDKEKGIVRDVFGYPMKALGGGQYRTLMGKIVTVLKNPRTLRSRVAPSKKPFAVSIDGEPVYLTAKRQPYVKGPDRKPRFISLDEVVVRENPTLAAFVQGGRGLRARDLVQHGSGPRGGYSPEERERLPRAAFLKPETRGWPVSDENHAHIALTYMVRGFGSRGEYPTLIRRLAQHWPVDANPDIWADYTRKKPYIERMCGCQMPTLAELRVDLRSR